ncbi:hypothetical protein K6U06_24315 [Acidiferrimicrobium sp. IK]|uniref:hypothetical protein n=1 Tax=Acidiferrimicrobium sp. IK TaxID=2871700 RepID=UPI0021CAF7A3|nr:hypothetical protein [Acidiferrimicrobium sp. IK]MCU4187504.1 hypothetical protein [Acidiferrimicrobium sp. IK]
MVPAAIKAPLDYGFAMAVSVMTIVFSFFCDPRSTGWIVFAVGVVMAVSVLVAAVRPVPRDDRS